MTSFSNPTAQARVEELVHKLRGVRTPVDAQALATEIADLLESGEFKPAHRGGDTSS